MLPTVRISADKNSLPPSVSMCYLVVRLVSTSSMGRGWNGGGRGGKNEAPRCPACYNTASKMPKHSVSSNVRASPRPSFCPDTFLHRAPSCDLSLTLVKRKLETLDETKFIRGSNQTFEVMNALPRSPLCAETSNRTQIACQQRHS